MGNYPLSLTDLVLSCFELPPPLSQVDVCMLECFLNKCKKISFLPFLFFFFFSQYKHLKEEGDPNTQIEGKQTDDWLCVDFGKYL